LSLLLLNIERERDVDFGVVVVYRAAAVINEKKKMSKTTTVKEVNDDDDDDFFLLLLLLSVLSFNDDDDINTKCSPLLVLISVILTLLDTDGRDILCYLLLLFSLFLFFCHLCCVRRSVIIRPDVSTTTA